MWPRVTTDNSPFERYCLNEKYTCRITEGYKFCCGALRMTPQDVIHEVEWIRFGERI